MNDQDHGPADENLRLLPWLSAGGAGAGRGKVHGRADVRRALPARGAHQR